MMNIEVWTDTACPFCYIGKTKFEMALEQFEHAKQVQVNYRAYQINPSGKKGTGRNLDEELSVMHHLPLAKAKLMNQQVGIQAKEVGLNFDFGKAIATNSKDSLRLAYFANESNKMGEMIHAEQKAYLEDGLDIGDFQVLADLAAGIGLDRAQAMTALMSDQFDDQIKRDKKEGIELGIQGVPFFIIDHKYAISGAQPVSVFLAALNSTWQENHLVDKGVGAEDDGMCKDGVCKINK